MWSCARRAHKYVVQLRGVYWRMTVKLDVAEVRNENAPCIHLGPDCGKEGLTRTRIHKLAEITLL